MLEKENALLKRKLQRLEGDPNPDPNHEEDMRRIEAFMNNHCGELEAENLGECRRYFKKMREMYHSKLSEYVKELTFISEKL
jgi:hypothetical protein